MKAYLKPILLLADSQLLFCADLDCHPIKPLVELVGRSSPKAAYIGSSNDDNPAYYEIFAGAMEQQQIKDCCNVSASYKENGKSFLEQADIILLAGGDAKKGWDKMKRSGIAELIRRRYLEGALLVGVSAGAVQLGMTGWDAQLATFATFGLVPLIVDVHDEKANWHNLQNIVKKQSGTGIGIPLGSGLIYHTDHSLEAVNKPLHEYWVQDHKLKNHFIFPKSG